MHTRYSYLYEDDVFKLITTFPSNRLILPFETCTAFYCFCMFCIELLGSGSCNITSMLSLKLCHLHTISLHLINIIDLYVI